MFKALLVSCVLNSIASFTGSATTSPENCSIVCATIVPLLAPVVLICNGAVLFDSVVSLLFELALVAGNEPIPTLVLNLASP